MGQGRVWITGYPVYWLIASDKICVESVKSTAEVFKVTFDAIFDESGTHGDSDLVVFAGFICEPSKAGQLSELWKKRLEQFDVVLKFFHMTEMNWKYLRSNDAAEKGKLESLVSDLADIACGHMTEGVINTITMQEFRALPQDQRKRHKNAFYYAFEAGVLALANASQNAYDHLNLICDDSEEHAGECLKAFKHLKRKNVAVEAKLPIISFCDDRFFPPLQATDLFAYCYRQGRTRARPGLWNKPLAIFQSAFSNVDRKGISLSDNEVVSGKSE